LKTTSLKRMIGRTWLLVVGLFLFVYSLSMTDAEADPENTLEPSEDVTETPEDSSSTKTPEDSSSTKTPKDSSSKKEKSDVVKDIKEDKQEVKSRAL